MIPIPVCFRTLFSFLFFIISFCSSAQSYKADLAEADNFYVSGKYPEAQSIYLANAGNLSPEQQYNLAICYYNKNSADGNTNGMQWLLKAAERGYSISMNTIAYCYQIGLGVAKDSLQRVAWTKKSADLGDKVGLANLGYFYETGYVVPKDYTKAKELYLKAIEKGSYQTNYSLGMLEVNNSNFTNAYHYIEKAAVNAYVPAQFQLGKMYEDGIGIDKKDPDEAFRWYYKIKYVKEFSSFYETATKNLRKLGQVEPMTDLNQVRPLLLKLVSRAAEKYYDLRGREIKPYNPDSEIGSGKTTYYTSLLDLGFKNAYIKKYSYNQRQSATVVKAVESYSYYGELMHNSTLDAALKVYNQWAAILKNVLPDWKVTENFTAGSNIGTTVLSKTINGINYVIDLRTIKPSGNRQVLFTIKYYGNL